MHKNSLSKSSQSNCPTVGDRHIGMEPDEVPSQEAQGRGEGLADTKSSCAAPCEGTPDRTLQHDRRARTPAAVSCQGLSPGESRGPPACTGATQCYKVSLATDKAGALPPPCWSWEPVAQSDHIQKKKVVCAWMSQKQRQTSNDKVTRTWHGIFLPSAESLKKVGKQEG